MRARHRLYGQDPTEQYSRRTPPTPAFTRHGARLITPRRPCRSPRPPAGGTSCPTRRPPIPWSTRICSGPACRNAKISTSRGQQAGGRKQARCGLRMRPGGAKTGQRRRRLHDAAEKRSWVRSNRPLFLINAREFFFFFFPLDTPEAGQRLVSGQIHRHDTTCLLSPQKYKKKIRACDRRLRDSGIHAAVHGRGSFSPLRRHLSAYTPSSAPPKTSSQTRSRCSRRATRAANRRQDERPRAPPGQPQTPATISPPHTFVRPARRGAALWGGRRQHE